MADEWQMTSLGDLIDVKHGFAFSGEFIHDEPCGDVLLTPGNFAIGGGFKSDKFKYYDGPVPEEFVLKTGDLLLTMTDLSKESDTLGFPAFVPSRVDGRRYLHNQRLGKVLIKDKGTLDEKYLHYLLHGFEYRHEVLASATGTTVKHTSPDRIKQFQFRRPRIDEQCAIAHILGTLDDKIDLNRRMNETLEAVARAIFKSWFVDFDPIHAKAEGRDTGLPKHIADLFPDSFEDSELGEIPKGWEASHVGNFMINFDSKRIPVSGRDRKKRQGRYPYHGAAGIMDYIDDFLFDGIYLLVGEDGSVVQSSGTAVTQYVWGKFWVNNHAHVLQGKNSVSTEQLYLYFQFETVVPYVTGAVQPKLSQGRMNTMPFVFAGKRISTAFAEIVRPLFVKLRENSDMNKTLSTLRDSLLPRLISGKLRVNDVDALQQLRYRTLEKY